jgi:site-specific recombinase XerD
VLANTRQNLLNALRRAQRQHGLKEWTLHSFRHAFCSELVRRGVGVETVRVMAGHADLKTTARYLHAAHEDLVSATRALSGTGNSVVTGREPVREARGK